MCKSRLKSVDPEAIKDQPDAKSIMNIPYYEVDLTIDEHRATLLEAERGFLRAQGTLKYLKHLEKNSVGPELCPICKQMPENKVSRKKKTNCPYYFLLVVFYSQKYGDIASKIPNILRV